MVWINRLCLYILAVIPLVFIRGRGGGKKSDNGMHQVPTFKLNLMLGVLSPKRPHSFYNVTQRHILFLQRPKFLEIFTWRPKIYKKLRKISYFEGKKHTFYLDDPIFKTITENPHFYNFFTEWSPIALCDMLPKDHWRCRHTECISKINDIALFSLWKCARDQV